MITTYAMSLTSKRWSEVTRTSLVDAVSDWLAEAYPYDTRPTTTAVRVREGAHDPVFRVEINESDKRNQAINQTVITVATLGTSLVFEIRLLLRPTGQSVLPRRRITTPNKQLTELCLKIATELKIRDAEQPIDGGIHIVSQIVEGESLAAFAEAPGRRLPIVVEHTQDRIPTAHVTGSLGVILLGIAHVFHTTSSEAVAAFNEFRRERLLSPNAITIIWPAPHPPTQIYDKDTQHVLVPLIEAAASSLQPVVVPQLPRGRSGLGVAPGPKLPPTLDLRPLAQPVTTAIPDPQIGQLETDNAQLRNQIDDLTRTQDELLENIADTDLLNAALVDERDRYLGQLTAFLSLQDSADWPRTPKDAVDRALKMCPNLIFHERSRTSSDDAQTQNGKRILESLIELNNIASRLKEGRIPLHMFEIHCRDRLNFAADVSDTAKHRFSDDYAIDWLGEIVYATPHIRCGDIRIHFYLDRVRLQVVIAYVGRHLRDKSTY
ncbi:MAG: hypothetical protein AAB018_03815 [Actinomycetota bacterium]